MALWLFKILRNYCWHALTLFYSLILHLNHQNVPKQGPTIIYANHRNFVIDGMHFMIGFQRQVKSITAAVSLKQKIIGGFLKYSDGIIGVQRQQDVPFQQGKGVITNIDGNILKGKDSAFSELPTGSQILTEDDRKFKIIKIISDDQIFIDTEQNQTINQTYKVRPKLSFDTFFDQAYNALNKGDCLIMFPEGGSHDMPKLRPLKAGIAVIALGAAIKYGTKVKLVPCGINLHKHHFFRSKVIMEYGEAHEVPEELIQLYKTDKKAATEQFLQVIQKNLKQMTIQFDSYDQLPLLMLSRQLYTNSSVRQLSIKDKLELNRRFAKGFMEARKHPQYYQTYNKLKQLSAFLEKQGISINNRPVKHHKTIVQIIILTLKIFLLGILILPGLLLWGPAASLIKYLVEKQRKRRFKLVKIPQLCNNVVGGYKIFFGGVIYPIMLIFIPILFYFSINHFRMFKSKNRLIITLVFFILQLIYAHLVVKLYDRFVLMCNKFKFLYLRLFEVGKYDYFITTKKQLQADIVSIVEVIGEDVLQNFQSRRIIDRSQLITF